MTITPPVPKSCLNCPSLLSVTESVTHFNKSVGTAVCARYGSPVGSAHMTDQQQQKIGEAIAKNCGSYGEPRPAAANWSTARFAVALPNPTVRTDAPNKELVTTCGSCTHYIKPDAVARELGWSTGLCEAKGKLILANRTTWEAKGCDYRAFGSPISDTSQLVMLPEYQEGFTVTSDPVKNFFAERRAGVTDPVDYETDKTVSTDDTEHGIRAWRKVEDPITSKFVYLPIYRLDFFDDKERAKIPRTGDDEHPEDYVDHNFYTYRTAVLWTELDMTPGLWGQPGTGKTEFFRYMAWLMCLPFERISITASTDVEDLIGSMRFSKEKGTYFSYGRLPKAWVKPCVLCLDEPNVGQPDIWQRIRPLTDDSKQMVIDENDNEALKRHDDCYMGMAMNPAWDAKNVGAHMISDADVNRLMHMFIDLPPERLEKEIIRTACKHDGWDIPDADLKIVMDIAADLRSLVEDDTLPITWAIRPQLKVARALRWFDPMTAYRLASADFLEPEHQQTLLDVVRTHTAF